MGVRKGWLIILIVSGLAAGRALADPIITGPVMDSQGIISYTVQSDYQYGPNALRILLPGKLDPDKKYPVLYLLPVAKGPDEDRNTWGDGPGAILGNEGYLNKHENLAEKYGLICVFPVFDRTPWFGDNVQDAKVRQESYLLKVVIPFVESHYPVITESRGRLLLGFSKSGWGAVDLLLRHPDLFGRAAAWDAPLMMDKAGPWGSGEVFPTQDSFAPYSIPQLLEERASDLKKSRRLILMGYSGFRDHIQAAHNLMAHLDIPHDYSDGPERVHHWWSGWVPEAVDLLTGDRSGGDGGVSSVHLSDPLRGNAT